MYKKIRKSVADVLANAGDTEQFEWNRWLREPQVYLEKFPKPRIDIQNVNSYQAFPVLALYQVKNFTLTKTKISTAFKNVILQKKKTFKIFFMFAKPYQKQIKLFDTDAAKLNFILSFFYKDKELFLRTSKGKKESVVSLGTTCFLQNIEKFEVSTKSESVELARVNCIKQDYQLIKSEKPVIDIKLPSKSNVNNILSIPLPTTKQTTIKPLTTFNKLEKFPKITNIRILSVEEIKEQLQNSEQKKVLSFPINPLPEKPKQYNLKLTPIDKMHVPLFHLKNLQTKETRLKPDRLKLLQEAEVLRKNQNIKVNIKTNILNPGILSHLSAPIQDKPKEKIIKEKVIEKKLTEPKKSEQKIKTVSWEEIEGDFKTLLTHQKEGMRFLLNNKKALLSDELGTDAKTHTVCALVAALRIGTINNALIVSSTLHVGNKLVAEKIGYSEGWENQISKWGSELSCSTITSDINGSPPLLKENNQIYITTYDMLLNATGDLEKNKIFSNIDCLILDEAQVIISEKIEPERLFKFPKSKYLWIISSHPSGILEEKLIPLLKNHLPDFEQLDNLLNRSKYSLKNDLPDVIRQEHWLEFDKDQKQEFDNTIAQGRKRIQDLINSGNPFIIQSNIFTLIHQIKQIENFSTHNDNSPKVELLLEHLEAILINGQKTIIFSQYDKQGIQKIERMLKGNNIRYVLYQSGMPLKELENSVNTFKKESKINVMLAGLTAASIKIKLAEAPYFIHFDQWWNPINQWQYEDRTSNNNNFNQPSNNLSVINYFTNNSVGLNLRATMQKKGLLNKNLIESLSNEMIYSLISNEDWLDILGIEHPKTKKNIQFDIDKIYNELSVIKWDLLGQKVKAFFTKLGYKNLMLKPDALNNQSLIYGSSNKGINEFKTAILCLPFNAIDTELVNTFMKESLKNNNRLVVICSKEISKNLESRNDEKINFIDQETLANYISLFKVG